MKWGKREKMEIEFFKFVGGLDKEGKGIKIKNEWF